MFADSLKQKRTENERPKSLPLGTDKDTAFF